MINKKLTRAEMEKMLFHSEIIGQGSDGLIVRISSDMLFKIYYKEIFSTYHSKDIDKLDGEIRYNREAEKVMIEEGMMERTSLEEKIANIQQLQQTKSSGLIKGVGSYKDQLVGVYLKKLKGYQPLKDVYPTLKEKQQKKVLNTSRALLGDLYLHGIIPYKITEEDIMIRKRDLDVKLINLDDSRTKYKNKEYLNKHNYLKEKAINEYEEMVDRLDGRDIDYER